MGAGLKVSPLAPAAFPNMPVIKGVTFATAAAGVKYDGRDDVMLTLLAPGSSLAGVFTKSSTRSAAVLDCQAKLAEAQQDGPAALLVNSGNANAFTGKNGVTSVNSLCSAVARHLDVATERVFTASTGVIGEPLPHEKIEACLETLKQSLSEEGITQAAKAIMTTDTFPKGAFREVSIDGQSVRICGIAKGSGMIAPDMATMLAYVFTDAKIGADDLQELTTRGAEQTFNRITVDSDTSTSDTLIVAASGATGVNVQGQEEFNLAFQSVLRDLAHQIVKDGEGATKFIEVTVENALTADDAKCHALAIANSPLVKTAIAGEDPNWGRIVMAIGKSGAAADRDLISIRFGDVLVAEAGWVHPDYQEDEAAAHMKGEHIRIAVNLGLGREDATVWTCDLTHGYIEINADYRS